MLSGKRVRCLLFADTFSASTEVLTVLSYVEYPLCGWFVEYDNSSVGEEESFALRHLWAALTDWQVWLHILVYISVVGPREYFVTYLV